MTDWNINVPALFAIGALLLWGAFEWFIVPGSGSIYGYHTYMFGLWLFRAMFFVVIAGMLAITVSRLEERLRSLERR